MRIKIKTILALSITIAAFVSCSNKNNQNNNDSLTIGVMSSMDYLPLAIAQELGYFSDNNVEVTLQKFYSANERDAALQSYNLDGTVIDYTGGAIQSAGGIPLKFVSQCDGTFNLIVAKGSNIGNIEELKGKKIAISRNTVIEFCTDIALERAGISPNDSELAEINKIPLRLEMLSNSKIDATILPDPFATIAESAGNKTILKMSDIDVRVTGIAFHQKTLDDKIDAIKRFYVAYNKAVDELRNNPISKFENILTKDIGFPAALLTDIKLPEYSYAKQLAEHDIKVVESWLKTKNLVDENFDIHSIIATDILH